MNSIGRTNEGKLKKSDSELSIVPDSEPEPELLGQLSRRETPPYPEPTTKIDRKRDLDIIELSDSDDSCREETQPETIVLSDTESPTSLKGSKTKRSTHGTKGSHGLPPLKRRATTSATSHPSPASDSDSDELIELNSRPNKLASFAYASKPSQPKTRPARSSSVQAPKSEKIYELFASGLHYSHTEEEIHRLTRCVACDLEWTTKKTVAMKLDHIRKCQKKNDFTDETVMVLLAQELSKPPDTKKGPTGVGSSDITPTLMENVLKTTQPKKRGKRKEVMTTVIEIEHRHEVIRARAEALFDLSNNKDQKLKSCHSITSNRTATDIPSRPLSHFHEYPASKLGTKRKYDMVLGSLSQTPQEPQIDESESPESDSVQLKRKRDLSPSSTQLHAVSPEWLRAPS